MNEFITLYFIDRVGRHSQGNKQATDDQLIGFYFSNRLGPLKVMNSVKLSVWGGGNDRTGVITGTLLDKSAVGQ